LTFALRKAVEKIMKQSNPKSPTKPAKPQLTIRITCRGADVCNLDELIPLQGDLKTLSSEKYKKLKRSLLSKGFSFPFLVWKNEGKLYILDGHQRDTALKRLRAQGYTIPPLPISFIDAVDEREAREKILLLSSQYGEMTEESLLEYINLSGLDLEEVAQTVDLPNINLEKLIEAMEEESSGEAGQESLDLQYQVIVDCKNEQEQLKLIEKLEKQKYTCRASIL
jgi:ParB-like chromosome segregation protein Spo0J